jgi:transcriptional regulator
LLQDFMDEYSFVELVTAAPTLRITHIPVVLDRTDSRYGKILGHIGRQNPQNQAIENGQTGVAIFRGPHGYISPGWAGKTTAVPTWNFAVVHATGPLRAVTEKGALRQLLARLVEKYERYQPSGYDFGKVPEDYVSSLMNGLLGFELKIELLEGKFKLGQDRSPEEKRELLEHLRRAPQWERPLLEFAASYFRRFPANPKGD